MKKLFFYVPLLCMGLMMSCTKEFFAPEDEKPEWLGGSIYEELKNPKTLHGTFNYYTRIIDDLGYAEVLGRTGSKTIFPANDKAFEKFFASDNVFGVHSYEQLTLSMKKMLLNCSMIDNAILIENLSNVSNGSMSYTIGQAIKHATNTSIIDSISSVTSPMMPQYNSYFDQFRTKGGFMGLYDNTVAPMVHFTEDYILSNNMTIDGAESDFSVITGSEYEPGSAYVFRNKIITSDGEGVCQNGYIHQLDNVLVPPGNIAQMLRDGSDTKYFSRMLDYFSAPVLDQTTTNYYNSYARANNLPMYDAIYGVRYFSTWSQGTTFTKHETDASFHKEGTYLDWDPGWNAYYPKGSNQLKDIGAMLIPNDKAVFEYFTDETKGKYILDDYGSKRTGEVVFTEDRMEENLDSLFKKRPTIVCDIVKNLMKANFTNTVPSKFHTVLDDAGEFMGGDLTLGSLAKTNDGKYDVLIANNAVGYKMNKLLAPAKYRSVLGISSVKDIYHTMDEMLEDHTKGGNASTLGADMYFYLMSMNSWFSLFLPQDSKYDFMYIDPTSFGHVDGASAVHFTYNPETKGNFQIEGDVYLFDPITGSYTRDIAIDAKNIETKSFNSLIQDMLNYSTIVLDKNTQLGGNGNKYFQTKHGGTVYVSTDGGAAKVGDKVYGGIQMDNSKVAPATIVAVEPKENGYVYCLDRPVQPTVKSVYSALSENSSFDDFFTFMNGFEANSKYLVAAGISDDATGSVSGKSELEAYIMFSNMDERCMDYNVSILNAYNYTLFAPTNDAMQNAYKFLNLPKWSDVIECFELDEDSKIVPKSPADKTKAKAMIEAMRDFVYYHFQNGTVYADKNVKAGSYQTFYSNKDGVIQKLNVEGGNGNISITDNSGRTVSTVASTNMKNIMARDIVFNAKKRQASAINSSSFITIHAIDEALCTGKDGDGNPSYDVNGLWK